MFETDKYIKNFIEAGYELGVLPVNEISTNISENGLSAIIYFVKNQINDFPFAPTKIDDFETEPFYNSLRFAFTFGLGIANEMQNEAISDNIYNHFISLRGFRYVDEVIEDILGIGYGSWTSKLIHSHLKGCVKIITDDIKTITNEQVKTIYTKCIELFMLYGFHVQSYVVEQNKNKNIDTYYVSQSQDGRIVHFVNRKQEKVGFSNEVTCFAENSLANTNCSINMPTSLRIIDDYALKGTKFGKFTFPNTLKRIGVGALLNCPYLKTVYLPEGLHSIGPKAFSGCKNLQEIEIPSTVVSIGGGAFSACDRLESFKISANNKNYVEHEGFLYSKNMEVLVSVWKHAYRIDIPVETKYISNYAFFRCNADSITIPDGVETIGDFSFGWCPNLREINIPSSVKKISDTAFIGCQKLEKINVDNENLCYSDKCGILFNKDLSTLICVPLKASFKIDELLSGVEMLGVGAFYSNKRIMGNIKFPVSIKSVGHDCFCNCDNITGVEFNSSNVDLHECCFEKCKQLRSVIIKATNISLGKSCFSKDTELEYVSISGSLNVLPESVFEGCTLLHTIEYDSIPLRMGKKAFKDSGLSSIVLYNGLKYIESECFSGCVNLKYIDFPDSVEELGSSAFAGCTNLSQIKLSSEITSIQKGTFSGCSKLKSIALFDKVETIKSLAFEGCYALNNISLGKSITTIADDSFKNCNNLESVDFFSNGLLEKKYSSEKNLSTYFPHIVNVKIREGIEKIGDKAFNNSHIVEISLPHTLITIGDGAFGGCCKLKKVSISDIESWCKIIFHGVSSNPIHYSKNLYINDHILEVLDYPSNLTDVNSYAFTGCQTLKHISIPIGIENLKEHAFSGCINVNTISLPYSLHRIENSVFEDCESIQFLELSQNINYIGKAAFKNCKSLRTIDLPTGIDILNSEVIYGCESLTNVKIPQSVEVIGTNAFHGCKSITDIHISQNITKIDDVFSSMSSLENISVHSNNENFCSVDGVLFDREKKILLRYPCNYKNDLYVLPQSVKVIGKKAFDGCGNLRFIGLPKDLEEIDNFAFNQCTSLVELNIPDSVVKIGTSLFVGCTGLKKINFPRNLKSTKGGFGGISIRPLFGNCISLEEINFPDNIDAIGGFAGCVSLKHIVIPESVKTINSSAFKGCVGLVSVEIPSGLNTIKYSAFEGCTSLKSITLPESIESIQSSAFKDCSALVKVNIPCQLKSFGSSVFNGCTGLKSIDLPTSIKEIPSFTFHDSGLTSIFIHKDVVKIGDHAFCNCPIESYHVEKDNVEYSSDEDGVLYNKQQTVLLKFPSGKILDTYKVKDTVVRLGECAFKKCLLTNIVFPDSLKFGSSQMFAGCSKLKSVVLGSISNLSVYSFAKCVQIEEFDLSKFTSFGYSIFEDCPNLKKVILNSNNKTISSSTFKNCSSLCEINLQNVEIILNDAFNGCSSLERIDLGSNIKEISANSFANCSSLKEIHINKINIDELQINATSFDNIPPECKVFVPLEVIDRYLHRPEFQCFENLLPELF